MPEKPDIPQQIAASFVGVGALLVGFAVWEFYIKDILKARKEKKEHGRG